MDEPREGTRKAVERAERERRLAKALRANLQRRKEQARGERPAPPAAGAEEPERSA
ncbi:MAG TPA: hypothetical protein VJ770_07095 [Stellaceae bacterium]|nr:hypothetical protein [Stellaceae bacterium]